MNSMLLLACTNDPMAKNRLSNEPVPVNYFSPNKLLVFAQTVVHPVANVCTCFQAQFPPSQAL
ncbi:hypothetical protein BWI97_16590 [Siphonobacter sp. BAB-5405]|nr:hypothetical protein BWI97_16590 [Siphonobacter sp. BAB-5405]